MEIDGKCKWQTTAESSKLELQSPEMHDHQVLNGELKEWATSERQQNIDGDAYWYQLLDEESRLCLWSEHEWIRTISASQDKDNHRLHIYLKIEKHALTVAATCVVKVSSDLKWKSRSHTVNTGCTDAIPSCIDVFGIGADA